MPKETKPQLKPGDLVYRVVDYDLPTDEPHTWRVETATVVTASDRQITLSGASKIKLSGQRFKPYSLGLLFFITEEQAVTDFLARQRKEVESAERAIDEAMRAMTWVRSLYPDLNVEVRRG